MSEFLADLIRRAEQPSPILARRRRALFEPLTPWRDGGILGRDPAFAQAPREEQVWSVSADRTAGAAAAPRAADAVSSDSGGERPAAELPPPAKPRRRAPRHVTEPEVARAERDVGSQAIPTSPPRPTPEPPTATPGREASATRPPVRIAPVVVARATAPPTSPLPARPRDSMAERLPPRRSGMTTSDLAAAVAARPAGRPRETPVTATTAGRPAAAPRIERAVALVAAAQPRLAAASPERAPAGPPPVLITIGRVEVRAQSNESGPPREARPRAGPRLTLEDYLRERTAAGR